MSIYRLDSDTEYKIDSFDCGDSDLNDFKNDAVIFPSAYFENKRIIKNDPHI